MTDAGMVFTWGFNRYGQCGNGSKDNTVPEPALVDLSNIPAGGLGSSPKVCLFEPLTNLAASECSEVVLLRGFHMNVVGFDGGLFGRFLWVVLCDVICNVQVTCADEHMMPKGA